jgi:quercetin dioxygenase-like cupin family protein
MVNDELVDGVERVIGEGDLVFIPAGTLHGIKETISITWLNIRYDMAE